VGEASVRVECAPPEFDHSCTRNHGYYAGGAWYVPVKLVVLAGLVPGAHEGKGLGNQFLTDLNEADVLLHGRDARSGRQISSGQELDHRDVVEITTTN